MKLSLPGGRSNFWCMKLSLIITAIIIITIIITVFIIFLLLLLVYSCISVRSVSVEPTQITDDKYQI